MIQGRKNVFGCAVNFLRGKKCVFCGSFKICKTKRGYILDSFTNKALFLTDETVKPVRVYEGNVVKRYQNYGGGVRK